MLAFQHPFMDLMWRGTGADGRRFSRTREPGDQSTLNFRQVSATSTANVEAHIDWRAVAFAAGVGGVTAILMPPGTGPARDTMDPILSIKAAALPRRGAVRRSMGRCPGGAVARDARGRRVSPNAVQLRARRCRIPTNNMLLAHVSSAAPSADSGRAFRPRRRAERSGCAWGPRRPEFRRSRRPRRGSSVDPTKALRSE